MTRLSVNINKIATLRNARGENNPNVVQVAQDCERFGAQGITVHPRSDERHIKYQDVIELNEVVETEFNIEGYPDKRFIDLIDNIRPAQATLVPDGPDVLTSNQGWDALTQKDFLKEVIAELKNSGVRVSIFVDPNPKMIQGAIEVGADRVELYTEPYATNYPLDRDKAVLNYIQSAKEAQKLGLAVNAGHDLDLHNLKFLRQSIPNLAEVSIGHALVCDALYYGLENTIQMYLRQLE